jgi:hypothetical protein
MYAYFFKIYTVVPYIQFFIYLQSILDNSSFNKTRSKEICAYCNLTWGVSRFYLSASKSAVLTKMCFEHKMFHFALQNLFTTCFVQINQSI